MNDAKPKPPVPGPVWKAVELDLFRELMAAARPYDEIAVALARAGWPLRNVKHLQHKAYKLRIKYTFKHQKENTAVLRKIRTKVLQKPVEVPAAPPVFVEPTSKLEPLGAVGWSLGCQYAYRTGGNLPGQRWRFCGRSCVEGRSYCPAHCEAVYIKLMPRGEHASGRTT